MGVFWHPPPPPARCSPDACSTASAGCCQAHSLGPPPARWRALPSITSGCVLPPCRAVERGVRSGGGRGGQQDCRLPPGPPGRLAAEPGGAAHRRPQAGAPVGAVAGGERRAAAGLRRGGAAGGRGADGGSTPCLPRPAGAVAGAGARVQVWVGQTPLQALASPLTCSETWRQALRCVNSSVLHDGRRCCRWCVRPIRARSPPHALLPPPSWVRCHQRRQRRQGRDKQWRADTLVAKGKMQAGSLLPVDCTGACLPLEALRAGLLAPSGLVRARNAAHCYKARGLALSAPLRCQHGMAPPLRRQTL